MSENTTNNAAVRCGRCHRLLKNEDARRVGYGKVCYSKAFGGPFPGKGRGSSGRSVSMSAAKEKEPGPVAACPMFTGDVICSIGPDGEPVTNVPQRIVRHSPTGFAWGYGGSGPAELALNILSMYIGQEEAQRGGLYQRFKERFIVPMPEAGGVIKRTDILEWLSEQGAEAVPGA